MELYIKVVFWWLIVTIASCLHENWCKALTKRQVRVNTYCIVFCSGMALWAGSLVWG